MLRRPKTVNFWASRLPHWEVEDGRYFITMHVAGAIPQAGKDQIRAAAERLRETTSRSPDWIKLLRRVFAGMERWLDRARHNPWIQQQDVAELIAEAIETRQQRGNWNMFSFALMPNHVHLFGEIPNGEMKSALEGFKRWTGHKAMQLLDPKPERFWQREWFDHWSRSDEQDDRILAYIRNNPIKAGLATQYLSWPYYYCTGN
jgi:REP element-mobilizing transposase RayT